MFLFTVTKPGLRQAGALALCAVCLAGTVTAAVRLAGKSVAASATVQTTIENTQDIGTYFTGYGFEVDLSTAAVDKVKIPKKWDDSFTAFNQVVGESGLTLADYKGKTVEKWTVLCPARSDGATDTYCVLLVYKAKPVGAYLLEKPSGTVSIRFRCDKGKNPFAASIKQGRASGTYGRTRQIIPASKQESEISSAPRHKACDCFVPVGCLVMCCLKYI